MADRYERRSRSPPRRPKAQSGGFRWKDKRSTTTSSNSREDGSRRGLDRGYHRRGRSRSRSRSPQRTRLRSRSRSRSPARSSSNKPKPQEEDSANAKGIFKSKHENETPAEREARKQRKREKKRAAAAAGAAGPAQAMIIVHVNDRLGTKTSIPCLASDSIGDFKAMVAAHIGREPNALLLKRQGERPFKDFLTLEDYSISNNCQLDLEVGTGD